MADKSFLMRLDDLARWPVIKLFGEHPPQRRPWRWTSTFILLAAVIGYACLVFWPTRVGVGFSIAILANSFAYPIKAYGPIKPWGSLENVDEREKVVRAETYLISLSILSITAIICLIFVSWWSLFANRSVLSLQWSMIGLVQLLLTIWAAGPTCIASWREPIIDVDDLP